MCESRTCVNCGSEQQYLFKGRCKSCYKYFTRHGVDRKKNVQRNPKRTQAQNCINCGELVELDKRIVKGRCTACDRYLRLHGVERSNIRKRLTYPAWCSVCGMEMTPQTRKVGDKCEKCFRYEQRTGRQRPQEVYPAKGLCKSCHIRLVRYRRARMCETCMKYKRKYGKSRPRWLDEQACRICGKPTHTHYRRSGRCPNCSKYKCKTGRERPEHLWGKGKHGWCDCGKPANHSVRVTIHKHAEDMPLCDECYSIHMQHVRWYGDGKRSALPAADD